nr:tocopherol cyclase family protein [uncultured Blautia sp.]
MKETCIHKGCAAFLFPYFEGWYLKHQNRDDTIAFIPAVHADQNGQWTVSLQIVTEEGSWYFTYPKEACRISRKPFAVRIGRNIFTEKGIQLDIKSRDLTVKGSIAYGPFDRLKYDIMGFFKYIPFLQCSHGVLSMHHSLRGGLTVNGRKISMTGGRGYIETDKGRSFPKSYLWTQCGFGERSSVMLSAADIPFLGFHFQGCICVVHCRGREYRMATYLGVRIEEYGEGQVTVRQGKMRLCVHRLEEASHDLKAPVCGEMTRTIRESPSCRVRYEFWLGDGLVFDIISEQASFEQADESAGSTYFTSLHSPQ